MSDIIEVWSICSYIIIPITILIFCLFLYPYFDLHEAIIIIINFVKFHAEILELTSKILPNLVILFIILRIAIGSIAHNNYGLRT